MDKPWVKAPNKDAQMTAVAITSQGKILGIGLNKQIYFRDSLDHPWVKAPDDTGGFVGLAVTKDDTILGIGADNKIWTRSLKNFASNLWVKAPDQGGWIKGISVYHNGRILAVGSNNKLMTRANLKSPWKSAPNKGGEVTDVCVLKDRTVIGIGMNNRLFTRGPTLGSSWAATPDLGGGVIAIASHPWRGITPVEIEEKPAVTAKPAVVTKPAVITKPTIITKPILKPPVGEAEDPLDDVEETDLEDVSPAELEMSQFKPAPLLVESKPEDPPEVSCALMILFIIIWVSLCIKITQLDSKDEL